MREPLRIRTRQLKRGELLFPPEGRPNHLYLVQTGMITVCILKGETIHLYHAGSMQVLGEEGLVKGPPQGASAIAFKDTEVLEIPLDLIRPQIDGAQNAQGALMRGLLARLKICTTELRSLRVARQVQPCHPDHVAKVFGVLFHSARYKGKPDPDGTLVDWDVLRDYAVEIFLEDPIRLEEALRILVRLGYAEVLPHSGKVAQASVPPSENWAQIRFKNMAQIETFFEFYQHYHFKGGTNGILKINEKIRETTIAFLKVAEKYKADRSGMVTMPYKATVDAMKEILGKGFEADQIFRLEQKGLMVKRTSTQDGGLLSFLKPEFEQMVLTWKILKEVEQWNEKGFVDLASIPQSPELGGPGAPSSTEDTTTESSSAADPTLNSWKPLIMSGGTPTIRTEPQRPGELLCPICMSPVTATQSYCSICDCDLPKDAA